MESNKRTLQINPDLFKIKKRKKKPKINQPSIPEKEVININKTKKELLKKVKNYHQTKEVEKINCEKYKNRENYPTNLFESNELENSDFEREFNKSLNFLQNLEKINKEKKKKTNTKNTINRSKYRLAK